MSPLNMVESSVGTTAIDLCENTELRSTGLCNSDKLTHMHILTYTHTRQPTQTLAHSRRMMHIKGFVCCYHLLVTSSMNGRSLQLPEASFKVDFSSLAKTNCHRSLADNRQNCRSASFDTALLSATSSGHCASTSALTFSRCCDRYQDMICGYEAKHPKTMKDNLGYPGELADCNFEDNEL